MLTLSLAHACCTLSCSRAASPTRPQATLFVSMDDVLYSPAQCSVDIGRATMRGDQIIRSCLVSTHRKAMCLPTAAQVV